MAAAEEAGVSAGTELSGVDELVDGAEVAGNSDGAVSPVNISSDRVADGDVMIGDDRVGKGRGGQQNAT